MLTVNWMEQNESTIMFMVFAGVLTGRGFNRQRLESRGRLEDEGTKRTTAQVLNIFEKVPEPVIHLKVDEEHHQW